MQNVSKKILFLYGKDEGNNINEKDFKIEKTFLKTIFKKFKSVIIEEKDPDFILEKNFEKEKYSILLLSLEFDSSIDTIKLILDNKYKTNEIKVLSGENFIFNIYFKDYEGWFGKNSKPPKTIKLKEHEQFNYFLHYLEDNGMKKDKNPVKMNFNRDVVKLFSKPFDLVFYMDVFKEIFRTKYIKNLLADFKVTNISSKKNFEFKNYSALLKTLLKKGNIIIQKVEGDKKKFLEQLYFIIMYIYYYFDSDSFSKMIKMKNGDFGIDFFELFFDKKDAFTKNKNDECVKIMFNIVKNINQIKCLIKKFSTFLNCINAINQNIKRIYLICKKEKTHLEIKDIPLNLEEENINDIIEKIRNIKDFEYEKKFSILNLNFEFCKDLINKIGVDSNFENINSIIQTWQDEKTKQSLYLSVEIKKHELIQKSIKESNEKNNKILELITYDPLFGHPKDKNNEIDKLKQTQLILDKIDFEELEKSNKETIDNFFELFNKINFKNILPKKQYIDFINGLIEKIKRFDDLNIIFPIISFKDKEKEILKNLQKKFLHFLDISKGQNEKFNEITNKYFKEYIDIGLINEIKEILDKIEKLFNEKTKKNLYMKYIEIFAGKNEELISKLIQYISGDLKDANDATIRVLLSGINDENALQKLFKKFNDLSFSENEFFEKEDSEKIKILKSIIEYGYISEGYLNETEYLKKTNNVINSIIKKLKNYNFDLELANNIKNIKDNFYERINIICFDEKNKNIIPFDDLITKINNFITDSNNISEINKYINYFFPENDDKKRINDLNEQIKKITLKEYLHIKEEIKTFDKYLINAKKYNRLHKSNFFNIFYKYEKEKYSNKPLENAENDYLELEKLLDINNFNEIDKDRFNLILIEISKSEEKLESELNFIKNYFNKNDVDIKNIQSQLIVFSQKEKMKKIVEGIKKILDIFNIEKSDFYNELNKIIYTLDDEFNVESIQNIVKFLEEKEILKKHIKDIINKLTEKKDLIKFLKDKDVEGLRNLSEFVGEDDNSSLKASDIDDFIKCVGFVNELSKIKKKKDIDFYNEFIKICKNEKNKNIEAYIENVKRNFTELKDLYNKNIDKSEFTTQKIKDIYNYSQFTINSKNGMFYPLIKYKEKLEKIISFEEVLEVRDRALIKKNENDGKDNFNKIVEEFSIFIENIEDLILLLNEISNKGYPEDLSYEINILNGKLKIKNNEKKECRIKNEMIILSNILNIQKSEQENEYMNNSLVRFLYGRHFYTLTNFMRYEKGDVTHLLKYITNNHFDETKKSKYIYKVTKKAPLIDPIKNSLKNSGPFLKTLLEENGINEEEIYKKNKINNEGYIGLKSFFTYKDAHEKNIIKIYQNLTKNPPLAQTILICNESTTSEEIIAFMYRSILCEFNVLFSIVQLEFLDTEKKEIIIELINKLYTNKKDKLKSCLVFIYYNKQDDFIQELIKKPYHQNLSLIENENEDIILNDETIEIIQSDVCGIGKSTIIKDEILNSNKEYKYFPIGGDFKIIDVLERLRTLNLNENCILHIDLSDSNKIDLMKDFLFSFLVTKIYKYNENIFFLGDKIHIKIEVPNGFVDFLRKFPILKLFKNRKIEQMSKYKIESDLNSNIQIVCNYLKLLKEKKISDNNLFIKNLSYEKYKPSIEAKSLNQQTCEEIIREYFEIKNPTFYQLKCFINIIASQLRNFTNNYYLTVDRLIEVGQKKSQHDLKNIREYFIDALVKNTKHFTRGAYANLIESQAKAQKIQSDENENKEEEEFKIAIESLKNKISISYKQIKPSLIFANLDKASLTIITTCDKTSEEYTKLKQLYNSDSDNNKRKLIDYENLSADDFLKELKNVLNIRLNINKEEEKNEDEEEKKEEEKKEVIKRQKTKEEIEENRKKEEEEELKKLKEIVGSYVFTADNFIKLILVLFRIQSGIPVIMMGETGCGKTSLIRIMSQLMGIKMKILNIHAGVNDNDILEFMLGKTKDNNQNLLDLEVEKRNKMRVIEEKKQLELLEQMVFDVEDEITKLPNESDEEFLIRKAEEYKIRKEQIKKLKEDNQNEQNRFIDIKEKIWVFLDEINTCNSMGLISEMICKHTINGIPIFSNVTFIAACNPYRTFTKKPEVSGLVAKKDKKVFNLVYTVNPLPHSLLNFVFDFGNLSSEDEKRYIESMVSSTIKKTYGNNLNKSDFNRIQKLAVDTIVESQNFIRDNNEISAVSLREIRRFNIFFEFFYKYINDKKNNPDASNNSEYNFEIGKKIINLCIYICYYMRISDKSLREIFSRLMDRIFHDDFDNYPKEIQNYIINNINIPKGIAKNTALKENIFTLFVCINTQVPVFICGKPGCSKSLSVQLIFNSMKGENSDNDLFKTLPKLIMNSYQGSKTSTSKGVLKIFNKSRDIIRNMKQKDIKDQEKIISMIYFDEMGLAEISPNNPLKVIHSQLEYDENEEKVAFVGVSNWTLDASKMNRGIYLSIPEPKEDDLIETAITIGESLKENITDKYRTFLENLAFTYYNYKQMFNENNKEIEIKGNMKFKDFHGSRDYYCLIKDAVKLLIADSEKKEEEIGEEALVKNFGGLPFADMHNHNSIYCIRKIYRKKYLNIKIKSEYNVCKYIQNNIKSVDGRYLLIISKNSIAPYLITKFLNELKNNENEKKEYFFYLGSSFENDQFNEYYSVKILNKILSCMEEGKILILKNLETIYPSLYDLFNQNFTVVSEKNFARIALGSTNNSLSYVHPNFKCIILVNEDDIEKQEPPFLNRFEKHIISFESLINNEQKEISKYISKMLKDIVKLTYELIPNFKFDLEKELINCDLEEIEGIIYSFRNKVKNNLIKDEILKKIVPTFSQDILVAMKVSNFESQYAEDIKNIFNIYKKDEHSNISNFLEKTNKLKNIIYTFSNIHEDIEIKSIVNTNIKNNSKIEIKKESIIKKLVSSFKSENDFEALLKDFYDDNKKNVLLLQFVPNDCIKMNLINNIIENDEKERKKKNDNKIFVFVIYLYRIEKEVERKQKKIIKNNNSEQLKREEEEKKREKIAKEAKILKNQYLVSHLSDYKQIFIDNLNGVNVSIVEILESLNEEVYNMKELIDIKQQIKTNTFHSFSTIKYNFKNKIGNIEKTKYQKEMTEKINKKEEFKKKLQQSIQKQIKNEENVALVLFKNQDGIQNDDKDFISVLRKYQIYMIQLYLTKIIVKCEREHVFSFLLNEKNLQNETLKEIFDDYFNNINLNEEKPNLQMNSNEINILFGMNIPGIKPILENIIKYVNELKEEFFLNEENIRNNKNANQEYENDKMNFKRNQGILINRVIEGFRKNEIFLKLENKEKNKQLSEDIIINIIDDYFNIFLGEKYDCDYNNMKKILFFIIQLRFGEVKKKLLRRISKIILFVEANSKYIYIILDMFNMIYEYKNNYLDLINELIEENKENYNIVQNFDEIKKEINYPFYVILESMIQSIFNIQFFIEIENFKYFDFVRTCNNFLQNANIIEMNLRLNSRNIFQLKIFVQIGEFKHEENEQNIDIEFKNFIYLMTNEISILNKNKNINNERIIDELNIILEKEYQFLQNRLKNEKKYYTIILSFFGIKLSQIYNEKYHKKILKIILSDHNLIEKSHSIFSIIFDNNKISPKLEKEAEENNNEELLENYLKFTNEENGLYELLENQKENTILNDIILYLFESYVNVYFDSIKGDQDIILIKTIFGLSLDYLNKSLCFIDSVLKQNENILYQHLGFLLSVAYSKCYLKRFVDIITDDLKIQKAGNKAKIINIINGPDNNKFRHVLKIFILKLIRNKKPDYDSFLNFDFTKAQLNFVNNEEFNFKEKVQKSFDYSFLSLENNILYSNYFDKYILIDSKQFTLGKEDFIALIKNKPKEGLEIFLNLSINKIISNYTKENYLNQNKQILNNFSQWSIDIINNIQFTEIFKELFSLYFNPEKFIEKLKPKIEKITINEYEMLLYSYKIILTTQLSKEGNFYKSLLSKNMENYIKENYIPGGEPNENLWVTSVNEIEEFLKDTPDNGGQMKAAYICSCGKWYEVPKCGFPTSKSLCDYCFKEIGGINHNPVPRENHFRIFKNKDQEVNCLRNVRGWFKSDNYPRKTLQELKEDIKVYIKEEHKGIAVISQDLFNKENKKVRDLNQVSYRLLSFIFYSYLFYGKILGFVNDKIIDNIIQFNDFSIYDIMIKTWKFLENALKAKGINEIQIFLHLIYPKLINILMMIPKVENIQIRKNIEEKVTNLVNDTIDKYEEKKKTYIKYNNTYNQSDIYSIRFIIQELVTPLVYNENDYPFLKYFMIPNYPSKNEIKEVIKLVPEHNKKYPILINLLNDEGNVEALQNLSKINPFINSMLDYYSYKIKREDAKKVKIKDELRKIDNQSINKEFIDFKEGWQNFTEFLKEKQKTKKKEEYLLKYRCRPEIKIKQITEESELAYVLNDDGEYDFGMNIAASYQLFTEWQNLVLGNIINSNSQNGVLKYFIDQISKEILTQNATSNEIISFNLNNENSMFNSFEEIITAFSKRNCYNNDGTINYSNYKNIQYDFDLIEETIGKIILPGKKSFKPEVQRFITYGYEGYRGGNSTVILDYLSKYNQSPLSKQEKKILYEFSQRGKDYNNFMFSLQLLIFYLKNENYQSNYSIKDAINNIPDYVNIGNECKEFFEINDNFKLINLISIFEYIELLCYPQIVENVNDDYKKQINQEEINKINKYFYDDGKKLIKKILLATSVRKFISRYLSGKRGDNEIKEDENLLFFIQNKEEFWPKEIFNNQLFEKEFEEMIGSFNAQVNESLDFYEVLGGDMILLGDKKEFEEIKIENEIDTGELILGDFINENETEETLFKNNIKELKKRKKNRFIY